MKFEVSRWDESMATMRPWRKRVEYDVDNGGDVVIAAEQLRTQESDAKVLDAVTLEFTLLEVEWLRDNLSELLKVANAGLEEEQLELFNKGE